MIKNHIKKSVEYNRNYNNYLREKQSLFAQDSKQNAFEAKVFYKIFVRLENELLREYNCEKQLDDKILYCDVLYVSPQGRSRSYGKHGYTLEEVNQAIEDLPKVSHLLSNTNPQYERSYMTDSLRYDILKRDGFKCQLCGMGQIDGVRLHVDHIIPVSKGGRTIPSNLRTLCEACNMGKRDKYDSEGCN